jgi:hypothetical protein
MVDNAKLPESLVSVLLSQEINNPAKDGYLENQYFVGSTSFSLQSKTTAKQKPGWGFGWKGDSQFLNK